MVTRYILLAASLIAAIWATAPFYSCLWINNPGVDCAMFDEDISCGTDGRTYKNKCYLSKVHCSGLNVNLSHPGTCGQQTGTTRDPISQEVLINSVLCTILGRRNCDSTYEPTCGSDGRTYKNFCEFEKAKCTHHGLHVIHFGDCAA